MDAKKKNFTDPYKIISTKYMSFKSWLRIFEKLFSEYKPDFIYAKQGPNLFPEIIRTFTNNKGETVVRDKYHQSEF
jgi:hypothetical protein